jgi:electron transfer flavoprotein alpha subunit
MGAAWLGTAVIMDCTELAIDPDTKRMLQTKPVYGGKAMAVWVSKPEPQIATLRPRSVMPAEPDTSKKGEITTLSVTIDDSMIKGRLLETVSEEVKGIKLEEAEVIIAGGGGSGGSDGFKLLEELAKVLGGTIGVTRIPCDEGWMPTSLEIGQTGHIVSPNLYVAVGISGAPQHMAGCSGSRCIVAINRDPEAHIFKVADFGVVGDYREVLPTLIEKCKELVK